MLRLIRRHVAACPHTSSLYRRCKCPIHCYGTLGGEKIRRALDFTSWEAATATVNRWTAAGRVLDGVAGVLTTDAVSNFLHDLEHGQKRQPATLAKHRNLLEKRLLQWCGNDYSEIGDLDVTALRSFRASWPDSALTAQKNLERLRSFFTFCVHSKWIESNPAAALKPPKIGKPSERVKVFDADQVARIIAACDEYPERGPGSKDNPAKVKAFVLTLRYSGLRIGDVVGLRRDHVDANGRVFLRTQKTGESIYLPLPKKAAEALAAIANGGDLYFWTGNGLRKSAVADWQRSLRRVFKLAKVTGNPHMFRHTFATDLLSRGVPVEDVAVLLGHATPAVTMRYYSHWVKARRERLEERVKALWD
jgi:integrase